MSKEYYTELGYMEVTEKPIVGFCGLQMFMFTTGLIVGLNEYGYTGRYCFHTLEEAEKSLEEWNGEGLPPGNWIKYKGEGGEFHNKNYIENDGGEIDSI